MDQFDRGFAKVFFGTVICSVTAGVGSILFNYLLGLWSLLFLVALPIGAVITYYGVEEMSRHQSVSDKETSKENHK